MFGKIVKGVCVWVGGEGGGGRRVDVVDCWNGVGDVEHYLCDCTTTWWTVKGSSEYPDAFSAFVHCCDSKIRFLGQHLAVFLQRCASPCDTKSRHMPGVRVLYVCMHMQCVLVCL